MMAGTVDFVRVETLLAEAEFEDCQQIWYSSNLVYLVQLRAGDEQLAGIYKPGRGERPLWDFPPDLYRREAAAYRLAELLGWHFVPPTVLREGPHGPGSLQLFVRHNPEEHFFVQRDRPALVPHLQRICVFDLIANNADRKGGHCLLDEQDHIWGIDHGLCFHQQYKLRSVIWDWAGEAADPRWIADVKRTVSAVESDEALGELLLPEELRALAARMRRFANEGRFPIPGAERHYPWPLV